MSNIKIMFGIRPTSDYIHLGHVSILKNIANFINNLNTDKKIEVYIYLATYHALTTGTDKKKKEIAEKLLSSNIESSLYIQCYNVLTYYINDEKLKNVDIIFSSQRENISVLTLFMLIMNVMSYSEITSIPTIKEYKENMTKDEYLSAGFINYPLLQIADVLNLEPDYVFVGKDQRPNFKILDKVINKMKDIYNIEFNRPEIVYSDNVIIGYDGRKMSKSYNNYISLDDDEVILKDKIMLYPTDGHRKGEKGNPEKCLFFKFIKDFLSETELNSITEYCTNDEALCKKCKEKYGSNLIYLKEQVRK